MCRNWNWTHPDRKQKSPKLGNTHKLPLDPDSCPRPKVINGHQPAPRRTPASTPTPQPDTMDVPRAQECVETATEPTQTENSPKNTSSEERHRTSFDYVSCCVAGRTQNDSPYCRANTQQAFHLYFESTRSRAHSIFTEYSVYIHWMLSHYSLSTQCSPSEKWFHCRTYCLTLSRVW